MGGFEIEMIEDAHEIGGEVGEIEGAVVVVRLAVAARVPGAGVELAGEHRELVGEVLAPPADAVQEDDQRPVTIVLDGDAGRGPDQFGFRHGRLSRDDGGE